MERRCVLCCVCTFVLALVCPCSLRDMKRPVSRRFVRRVASVAPICSIMITCLLFLPVDYLFRCVPVLIVPVIFRGKRYCKQLLYCTSCTPTVRNAVRRKKPRSLLEFPCLRRDAGGVFLVIASGAGSLGKSIYVFFLVVGGWW